MSLPASPSAQESETHELSVPVDQLREEVRLLRMAIDELRDDVVWAARQVLSAGYEVAPSQMPHRSLDPLAPDADYCSSDDMQQFVPELSEPPPTVPPAATPTVAETRVAPTTTVTADVPTNRGKHSPLYMRIYQQPLLTEIVRAVGYEQLPREEVLRRLEPLGEKYGRERTIEVARELLASLPGPHDDWALSDDARRGARALLGPPPLESINAIPEPDINPLAEKQSNSETPSGDAQASGKVVGVKASRKVVLARFREHLDDTEEVTADVPDDIQKLLGDRGRMIPDLILGEEPPYELLTVRRTLSATQRHDMQQWLEVSDFGNQATRAWPHETAGGWEWDYEVIASKQGNDESDADDACETANQAED